MTEKKAIKILERKTTIPKDGETFEEISKAFDVAMSALEKLIPKKSKHKGCYGNDGIWYEWNGVNGRPYELCPNCGTNLCCEMPNDKKPKFCDNCGQALDWSEND